MANRVTWRDGRRVVEPIPVPQTVSRFQARAALLHAGKLAEVEAAIAQASPMDQLAWAETTEWLRDSPTINAIGAAVGLSPSDIDDLFRVAAGITA